ncbi:MULTISPECIES: hypothetical protein [unclassified Streptomyces]|uniref:hypothetical protein n=1 Tax=unclassified Streptomyces TaxID=2593676 RepID=UPI0013A6E5BB|nr:MULTISPECIES: hypothetical protein [unclassified Streptomyces]QZZ25294.1 hypothetical protein A7X85_02340 [Streptomyces sp. ST1015]
MVHFTEYLADRQAAAMTVRAIGVEQVVFGRLLEVCRDQGLVGAGGKQHTEPDRTRG